MAQYHHLIFVVLFVIYHTFMFHTLELSSEHIRQCNISDSDRIDQAQPFQISETFPMDTSLERLSSAEKENSQIISYATDLTTNISEGLDSDVNESVTNFTLSWVRMCVVISDLTKSLLSRGLERFKKEIGAHISVGLSVIDIRDNHSNSDLNVVKARFPEFLFRKFGARTKLSCRDANKLNQPPTTSTCTDLQRALEFSEALLHCRDHTRENGWIVLLDGSATFCDGGLNHIITLLSLLAHGPSSWRSAHFSGFLSGLALPASLAHHFYDTVSANLSSTGQPGWWAAGRDFQYPGSLLRRTRRASDGTLRTEALLGSSSGLPLRGPGETCAVVPLSRAASSIFDANRP